MKESIPILKNLWTSSVESGMPSVYQEGSLWNISNISSVTLKSQSWMKETNPILFQIKNIVRDIILEPLGVPDLHPMSQKRPTRVPDGCQIYFLAGPKGQLCISNTDWLAGWVAGWLAPADLLKFQANEGHTTNTCLLLPSTQNWMKESTPILFQMKSIVKDITLEPLGVPDLHLRSQECPPKSGSVPDGCLLWGPIPSISLELDQGIDPNPFLNNNYGQVHYIRTPWGSH